MKYGECCFSGHAIYSGKGRTMVMPNGSSFLLGRRKCRSYFMRGLNPKKLDWTRASRIVRKKAVAFKTSKIQAPKMVKPIRPYVGLSLEELKKKIAPEKPEQASSQRTSKREKIKSLAKEGARK